VVGTESSAHRVFFENLSQVLCAESGGELHQEVLGALLAGSHRSCAVDETIFAEIPLLSGELPPHHTLRRAKYHAVQKVAGVELELAL
jgi:hypothetical protein